jgi:5-deoxy-glucuronate isomerase
VERSNDIRSPAPTEARIPTERLHLRHGDAADGRDPVHVTPERAGWGFAGLRVLRLEAGEERRILTGEDELLVLPLSGSCRVRCDDEDMYLTGRRSVWTRVSDFAYVPRDASVIIDSEAGGEFALPSARARRRLAPAYGPAEAVPIEVRGAGHATRQVTNFCAPGTFEADRLMAVELLTPAGNWSSYPPHKHDQEREGEAMLEEIYYFRVRGPHGYGMHRTYTDDGAIDATVTVRDGDVFLVPRGYHGPCVAAPDHDLYYLNVLAGPGATRTMAFCDDPLHHWVRETWAGRDTDPRVPMTGARPSEP